jgi:hypothetical protein
VATVLELLGVLSGPGKINDIPIAWQHAGRWFNHSMFSDYAHD